MRSKAGNRCPRCPESALSQPSVSEPLKTTPLHAAHLAAGARMVAFAGYDMPVQYRDGVLKEHLWTRQHAGVFDVSHMGPAFLILTDRSDDAEADHRAAAAILEPLVSGDVAGLRLAQLRYTLLLNPKGGMIDDLMIARPAAPDGHREWRAVPVLLAGGAGDRADAGGGRRSDHALAVGAH